MLATTYDLSSLYIDFTLAPAGVKLIDHFTQLAVYPEFVNVRKDRDIKIAILLSDMQSPFIKIPDNTLRLKAVFEFLEIGVNKVTQPYFDLILSYKDNVVFDAACRYIQLMNNHDYATWWSLNITFYDLQKESIKPREEKVSALQHAKDKTLISKEMDNISSKLKDYEARLFSNVNMKQKNVEDQLKKMSTYPEKFAEKFAGFNNEEFSEEEIESK